MNNRAVLYIFIFILAILISAFLIESKFSITALGIVLFLLVFIPTMINPGIGLVIIIISMLFSPESSVGHTATRAVSVRIEDIVLLIIVIAWLAKVALTKDLAAVFRTDLTSNYFLYILACTLSTVLASIFSSIDIGHSFFAILKYIEYFLLFLMVRDNLRTLQESKVYIVIFLFIALFVAVHSNVFIQQATSANIKFFRVAPPVETRAGGESGTLGGYFALMIAIIAGLALYSRSNTITMLLIGLEILLFRSLLYTLSRASYIALVAMAITLVVLTKRRKTELIYLLVVVSLVSIFFMPSMIRDRITSTVTVKEDFTGTHLGLEESPMDRITSYKTVLFQRFPKSPIFGYGVAKFFIDGQVFLVLCESGLLGLVLFLSIFTSLFKKAKDVLKVDSVNQNDFAMGLSVGFIAGFIGLMFHSLGSNTFIIIKVMEPFWFIAAIVLSLPRLLEKEEVHEDR